LFFFFYRKDKSSDWSSELYLHPSYVTEQAFELDFRALVSLPSGIEKAEWLATNTTAFFKHISVCYGALSEYCTANACPTASAPGRTQYFWHNEHGQRLYCSGPLYTDYVTSYIQELLTDEKVFPTKVGSGFPKGFVSLVQKIFLLLFRILVHIYWAHYHQAAKLDLHPHLNTLFKHFIIFSQEFALLEDSDTAVMASLITAL
uniref:Si:dkey-266m15.5 n=1 Tax=Latimeria chalumnae TaxID=7897 RepID=H3AJQ6_LATCH